jgi:hypothetical protein
VVTTDEALAEEGEIAVALPGGHAIAATLAGRDPTTDVALLRLGGAGLPPIALGATPVVPGALALVVGSREGAPVAALGVVSVAGPGWHSLRGGDPTGLTIAVAGVKLCKMAVAADEAALCPSVDENLAPRLELLEEVEVPRVARISDAAIFVLLGALLRAAPVSRPRAPSAASSSRMAGLGPPRPAATAPSTW